MHRLPGLGNGGTDLGADGLDRNRGLDAAACIARLPASPPGALNRQATDPAGVDQPQRAWTIPVAVATAHRIAVHPHRQWTPGADASTQ